MLNIIMNFDISIFINYLSHEHIKFFKEKNTKYGGLQQNPCKENQPLPHKI